MASQNNEKAEWWYREYGSTIEKIIKYSNLYTNYYRTEGSFGTDFKLSLFDLQMLEAIYLNEDRYLKMAQLAAELGMTQSSFSKNVNRLVRLGQVKKYHAENNKKDIFLRATQEGVQSYQQHQRYVYEKVFSRIIPLFQKMTKEQLDDFGRIMDIMGDFAQLFCDHPEKTSAIRLLPVESDRTI